VTHRFFRANPTFIAKCLITDVGSQPALFDDLATLIDQPGQLNTDDPAVADQIAYVLGMRLDFHQIPANVC
jgi:hypothetical protein